MVTIHDVLMALDRLTGGRVVKTLPDITQGAHPFVVMKTSGIVGKEVMEIPGIVYGDPEREANKIAVAMTLSEHDIELAGATGVDVLIAHHPIAEAASSGGVTLKHYLDLYGVAVMELHEAFHGLHPGIPFLHGHRVERAETSYGGEEGNVMFYGETFEDVRTMGDMLDRLDWFMEPSCADELLHVERRLAKTDQVIEASTVTRGKILLGERTSRVRHVLHIFPHTGFTVANMEQAVTEHPDIDTVLATISRVFPDNPLVTEAGKLGLNFLVGNSHVLEIFENGMPLAYALDALLPEVEVVLFRERVTSIPIRSAGNTALRRYAQTMCSDYLLNT